MGPSSWSIATEIEQAFDVFAVRIKCYSCCAGQFDPLMDDPLAVVVLLAWLASDDRQEVVPASRPSIGAR